MPRFENWGRSTLPDQRNERLQLEWRIDELASGRLQSSQQDQHGKERRMQVRMSSLADVGRNGIEPLQQERIDVRIQLEENPSGQTVRLFVVVDFRFGDAEDTSYQRAEQQGRGVAFLYGGKNVNSFGRI